MEIQDTNFDLIIVGGGLVGNCLALALQDSGLKIALVEAHTPAQLANSPAGDRALALSAGTAQALATIGIWQAVQAKVTPITDIHVSDRGHFGKARLSARKAQVDALGYVIVARDIETHVAELVKATAVTQFCPARVIDLSLNEEDASVAIKLADSTLTLTAKLLVGADGGNSAVRHLLGIGQQINEYQQTALVTTVKASVPHRNTAFERFTESGPLALLPIGNNHCSVVWTRKHEAAESLISANEEDFLKALQSCFGYKLGRLQLIAARRAFPVSLIRAERMQLGRALIIGNAAHQLHPVAGQGFNLGLRDVIDLSSMLKRQSASGSDVGAHDVLVDYVKTRQLDHDRTITFTDSLVKLFSNESILFAGTRNLGLVLFDHLPAAKAILAKHAMGMAQKLS